jgi:L-ascorbate metabolism protein UlaG (beta-lactamase superfamily)
MITTCLQREFNMYYLKKSGWGAFIICVALLAMLLTACGAQRSVSTETVQQASDHFDGKLFFNPQVPQPLPSSLDDLSKRGIFWFAWRWLFNNDRPVWPESKSFSQGHPGPPPSLHASKGTIRIIAVGHSTFLIQMDGLNILTDPIWSNRCSPVSWAGPERHKPPGILFDDLPPVDVVLVSHNHYDHLDLPTLKRLAARGTPRAIVPLGNLELVRGTGIPAVNELDWWQSVPLFSGVKITLVPAQHFSSRTPWDRNKTLWGGFIISGPSGNIYYSGDTGYGPHFLEIARRFAPIRFALLPISPFRPRQLQIPSVPVFSVNHMGPSEAVKAHIDLQAQLSIAAHFQVFQLGWDAFDDAPNELASALKEHDLKPDEFVAPAPGSIIELNTAAGKTGSPSCIEESVLRK